MRRPSGQGRSCIQLDSCQHVPVRGIAYSFVSLHAIVCHTEHGTHASDGLELIAAFRHNAIVKAYLRHEGTVDYSFAPYEVLDFSASRSD